MRVIFDQGLPITSASSVRTDFDINCVRGCQVNWTNWAPTCLPINPVIPSGNENESHRAVHPDNEMYNYSCEWKLNIAEIIVQQGCCCRWRWRRCDGLFDKDVSDFMFIFETKGFGYLGGSNETVWARHSGDFVIPLQDLIRHWGR